MEISSACFINVLDLTRSSCEKCDNRPFLRNRTCGPAIPLQRSNQLTVATEASCRVLTRQLASVAQLVRALDWNSRTAGLIPARGPAFLIIAPG